ncbi:hypothetical protein HY407_00600 [Candidatus Gottesmanbacteria bacterium]|nr:hypothetical protein [Candidatus Gottesmanbacteria bacterium]
MLETEQQQLPDTFLVGLREAIQTPPRDSLHGRMLDVHLAPPCQIIENQTMKIIDDLKEREDYFVELPTPISSPSAAHLVHRLLSYADDGERKVAHRVPVHTRMKKIDARLAIQAGARAIHLYGNSSENGGSSARTVEELKVELKDIAEIARDNGVVHLRASLEHATDTPPEEIGKFVDGIKEINTELGAKVITALGLPDTNGVVDSDWYKKVFTDLGDKIKQAGLIFFVHLHDDNQQALANAKKIVELAREKDIPVVVETVPDFYPGERNGTRPRFSELGEVLPGRSIPKDFNNIVGGSTWLEKRTIDIEEALRLYQEALHTHVAGVHTIKMGNYGNSQNGTMENLPAPGTYSIMGKNNFAWVQENVLKIEKSPDDVLQAVSLIGRELAAQKGNQPHGYTIGLAYLAAMMPQYILDKAESFGIPEQWLENDIPDLSILHDYIKLHFSESLAENTTIYQHPFLDNHTSV